MMPAIRRSSFPRSSSPGEGERVAPISIHLAVEAGGWPSESQLDALAVRAIDAALAASLLDLPLDAEISLLFTSDAAIRRLNALWRGKDVPTNVLSFPHVAGGPLLGDIVLA